MTAVAATRPPESGRIGPNAIIRVAEVLQERLGLAPTQEVFEAAGLTHHLRCPPGAMVDEADVGALHQALRRQLGEPLSREVAREAGVRTARYLLAHRIPSAAQGLLRRLPARWAARALCSAIARHAWTFAGSGAFHASSGSTVRLRIHHNPMCRHLPSSTPGCDFYTAVFEGLFRELVHPQARTVELTCEGCGADACVFEVRW